MLYLRDVLQLVVDGLDDGPLAQQNLVLRTHEHVPHVVAHARDELYPVDEEHLEKSLADIAPVPAELALDVLHVALVPERVAVIGIAWGNHEVEYFSAVVDDQVQLEAVEPAHGGLSFPGQTGESTVRVHALDVAHSQCRRIREADAGALAQKHVLDEQRQAEDHLLLQFHEAAVGGEDGEQVPHVAAEVFQVEVLEAAEASGVEQDEYDHYLRITHVVGLVPAAFAVIPSLLGSLFEGVFLPDF